MTCLAAGVGCVRFELRFALHKEEFTEFFFFFFLSFRGVHMGAAERLSQIFVLLGYLLMTLKVKS